MTLVTLNKDGGAVLSAEGERAREQRRALRLSLEPGEAWFAAAGAADIELIDLSASGLAVALPQAARDAVRGLSGVLRLGDRRIDVQLEPVRFDPRGGELRIGARFRDLSQEAWDQIGHFLIGGFSKKERELSRLELDPRKTLKFKGLTFLVELLRRKTLRQAIPLHVYSSTSPLDLRLHAAEIRWNAGRPTMLAMRQDQARLEIGASYSFLLPGKNSVTVFSARIVGAKDDAVWIEIPDEIRQCGFRESGRVVLTPEDELVGYLEDPRAPGISLSASVCEVSSGGLSLVVAERHDPFLPGDTMEILELELPSSTLGLSGTVRRAGRCGGRRGLEYGIQINTFARSSDRQRWDAFVFERLHPKLAVNDPRVARAAWHILDSSSYLNLWTPEPHREYLRDCFMTTWDGISTELGHMTILREGARKLGMLAASRVYPRTWLVHSLSIDQESRRRTRLFLDAARELYDALLHLVQRSSDSTHFVLYVQKEKRWSKLLYEDFVDAYVDQSALLLDEYRIYKRLSHPPATGVIEPENASFETIHGERLRSLSAAIGDLVPPIEYGALAYSEEQITFADFGQTHEPKHSSRQRKAVAVRQNGRLLAALFAEIGDQGTNVFGLVNQCRIFWWANPSGRELIKTSLLGRAIDIYREAGKTDFVFLDWDRTDDDCARHLDYTLVSDGIRWLAHLDVLPAWRSYIDEVLGQRGARSVAIANSASTSD